VLLVEDNAMNQVLAESHLSDLGCQTIVAGDGAVALSVIAETTFDLILMDCQMPVMDGFETTRRLREREGFGTHTPIIAMTANALNSDRAACLAAGMDDFLPKPYTKAELVTMLARWLPRRAASSPTARSTSAPDATTAATPGQAAPAKASDQSLPPVLDEAILHALIEGRPGGAALVTRLLRLFRESGSQQLAQIEAALTSGDDETLIRAAHTLKSSSATLGALRLAAIGKQIELAARAGQHRSHSADLAEWTASARIVFDAACAAQARLIQEVEQ
jgi:CheY-like chemotaxis protein/HPt (histidine-containing phosphotransfer) domain-containing protein